MSIQLRYAARSHVGLVRQNNQDSGYAGPHLLVLADGMGGPAGGDIASSVAVAHLAPLDDDSHAAEDLLDLLRKSIQEAHEELVQRSHSREELTGLGTTCVAILRSGNKMAMVHIGDSRAYLWRDEALTQVTVDHSFVQYLVESGEITAEQAEHHPKRSVLLRVLGDSQGEVTLDESVRAAVVGDRWLLCSDGLSGVVSAETIGDVLHHAATPEECCEQLVALALKSGAPDNVTTVVADVVDSDEVAANTAVQVVGAASISPAGASIGESTPAEKAAMLRRGRPLRAEDAQIVVKDPRKMSRLAKWITVGATLLVALGIVTGLKVAYSWTQTQYFLGMQNQQVTLFRGINQSIAGWDLYRAVKTYPLRERDLSPVIRERLDKTIILQDKDAAAELIESWRKARLLETDEATPSEALDNPRPQPGTDPSADPAGDPDVKPGTDPAADPGTDPGTGADSKAPAAWIDADNTSRPSSVTFGTNISVSDGTKRPGGN